jgi:8-oxo-dGTP pyrophosphatase MutT (NUDIX family)
MRQITACGMLLFRQTSQLEFLLMRHSWRWDLPKGHQEADEDELECALREMQEETGLSPDVVRVDPDFRFVTRYQVQPPYFDGEWVDKQYVIFLGYVPADAEIQPTEHAGYQWFLWQPPHQIQDFLLDPLLEAIRAYFERDHAPDAES